MYPNKKELKEREDNLYDQWEALIKQRSIMADKLLKIEKEMKLIKQIKELYQE